MIAADVIFSLAIARHRFEKGSSGGLLFLGKGLICCIVVARTEMSSPPRFPLTAGAARHTNTILAADWTLLMVFVKQPC